MRAQLHHGFPDWRVIALLATTVVVVWAYITDRVMVGSSGGSTPRPRWIWPWLHWCMFDRECRSHGCPKRVYIHPARAFVEFPSPDEQVWRRLRLIDGGRKG